MPDARAGIATRAGGGGRKPSKVGKIRDLEYVPWAQHTIFPGPDWLSSLPVQSFGNKHAPVCLSSRPSVCPHQ